MVVIKVRAKVSNGIHIMVKLPKILRKLLATRSKILSDRIVASQRELSSKGKTSTPYNSK